MSKHTESEKHLVQKQGAALARGGEGDNGPVVDMQDLQPMILSFQEHLAQEQAQHQSRIRGLATGFVLALVVVAAAPVYLISGMMRDHRAVLDRQREAQEASSRSLETALRDMAAASRDLRAALQNSPSPRPQVAAPVVAIPEQTNSAPVSPTPLTNAASPGTSAVVGITRSAPSNSAAAAEAVTTAETARVQRAGTAPSTDRVPDTAPTSRTAVATVQATDVATNAPAAKIVPPTGAKPPETPADLERLLRQIEESIAEKQRQLESRRNKGAGAP